MSIADLPAVMTVREVARALRLDVKTVYADIKAGRLKAIQVGRSIRVPRSSISLLLERGLGTK